MNNNTLFEIKKSRCPKCRKELIRLEPYSTKGVSEFWCDDCNIKITIDDKNRDELKETIDSSITTLNGIKIVSWKDGSWQDIANMVEAHYNDDIDITDYWKVGDSKRIELKNGEFVDLVLIGNNHDDLVTSVNGVTKAAFTVQTRDCLETKMRMFDSYDDPKFSSWNESEIRKYLNTAFKSLLSDELQSLIKTIRKVTYRYGYTGTYASYRDSTISEDDVFLLSEMEVYGAQTLDVSTWGSGSDGTQYEYYKTASNRIKYLGICGISARAWWLRSSIVGGTGYSLFRRVNSNGNVDYGIANYTHGLAPAFCI